MTNIKAMKERIEELEEENRQLRALLTPRLADHIDIPLTASQRAILDVIVAHPFASYEMLLSALEHLIPHGERLESIVKVHMHRLRAKLKPFDVRIRVVYTEGYYMSPEDKAKLPRLGDTRPETSIDWCRVKQEARA